MGQMQINGTVANRIAAYVFIPKTPAGYICCPLNYFQKNVSLQQRTLFDGAAQILLDDIDHLQRVILTVKRGAVEQVIEMDPVYGVRLFAYIQLDITRNEAAFLGFDL